uniref:Glutamyl-tRNA(Gln) amidotransferase subunit A, chloroplastic/mitochondrial n=1 Tax=Picocystis salinarum TaxID=88271 RepID=A0A7S3XCW8_9CHLO
MAGESFGCGKDVRTASTIRDIQKILNTREKTATQLVEDQLKALHALEPTLNNFISTQDQQAIWEAERIDAQLAQGKQVGRLAGVSMALKDNLAYTKLPTTAGSKILQGVTIPYNATAVERLLSEGAIIVGKTNMDEFGMGSTTENSAYKVSKNPWDLERVPGGSSGGSASATCAFQCVGSLGSDTGGSIRQPASFCGVVGLKPSYGRVSRYGLLAYASSLDVVGPITRSVEDAAILLSCMAGQDPMDSTSSSAPTCDFAEGLSSSVDAISRPLAGKRFGIIKETTGEGVDLEVLGVFTRAVQHLQVLGAEVEEISLSTFDAGLPAYYVLAPSEASSNLSRYDGVRYGPRPDAVNDLSDLYTKTRQEGFGAEVKRRILMGTYALSSGYYDAYYKRAQQIRQLIYQELNSSLSKFDALLCPTAPTAAYKIGEKTDDPLSMYIGDIMTVNVNLAGVPALSLPCGFTSGDSCLPVGLQIIGRMFSEADLLSIGHVFEQTASFANGTPSMTREVSPVAP